MDNAIARSLVRVHVICGVFFSKIVCNRILQTINFPESKVLISSGDIHTINYYIFTTLIFVFCLKEVVRNRTDAQLVV